MSLLTWFIMITKFFDQRRQRLQAIEAEKEFWSSTSLTDALNKLKGASNPFRALAETGKQAYEYHETNKTRCPAPSAPASGSPSRCSARPTPWSAACRPDCRCSRRSAPPRPSSACSARSSASTTRLIAIGVAGQASIDKVAGPVGEALIMTAIGLAVAVPAVLGYNILLRRNKGVQERVSHFTHELHAYLISGAKMGLGMEKGPTPIGKPAPAAALGTESHGDQCRRR
jgi:biopolymer transport protein ExbB